MDLSNCCIQNKIYFKWFENDHFSIEELNGKDSLPIELAHLIWIDKSMVDLMHNPIHWSFYVQDRFAMARGTLDFG